MNQRARAMAQLKASTNMDPDTQNEVLDEATLHLLEHFKTRKDRKEFLTDYCLIMGKSYLGKDREIPEINKDAIHFYSTGDLHEMSHDLADLMHREPPLMTAIFHAIEIYSNKKSSGGK